MLYRLTRIIVGIIASDSSHGDLNSCDTVNIAPDFKGLLIQAESSPKKFAHFQKLIAAQCPLAVLLFEPALRQPRKMAWQSPGCRLTF